MPLAMFDKRYIDIVYHSPEITFPDNPKHPASCLELKFFGHRLEGRFDGTIFIISHLHALDSLCRIWVRELFRSTAIIGCKKSCVDMSFTVSDIIFEFCSKEESKLPRTT